MNRAVKILIVGVFLIILTHVLFRFTGPNARPPNIVLISIDTWRGDYFSPEKMPLTYEWARKNCAVFPNAYANSTWTSPSHATMLSGLLQSQHKMDFNDSVIPPDIGMVQEELREAGYKTMAFTGGGYVSEAFGFGRGFDSFSDWWMFFDPKKKKSTFGELRDRCWLPLLKAEEALAISDNAQPLFVFAHTYFIHEYFLFNHEADEYPNAPRNELHADFMMAASAETKRECYDRAAKELDVRLYDFIQHVVNMSKPRNVAIIITSDHGEGLGDKHNDYLSFAHAHAPYSDQIHVPLAIYGMRKGEYDDLVSLKDIPAIIRALAKLDTGALVPSNDFIISEYVQYNRQLPPEPRTIAVTFPDKRILLTKNGDLSLFVDSSDTIDALSNDIREKQTALSENVKDELRALGYLQ